MTTADGFLASLAEQLEEPLVTTDRSLANVVRFHAGIEVALLGVN